MVNSQYILTNHVRERLRERFGHFEIAWDRTHQIDVLLNGLLEHSEQNCSYINNSSFMSYLYDRYGYDTRYEFLVNAEHGIVFVVNLIVENNKSLKLVKTCFPTDNQMFGVRTKYRKKLNPIKHRNTTMNRSKKWERLEAEIREEMMERALCESE